MNIPLPDTTRRSEDRYSLSNDIGVGEAPWASAAAQVPDKIVLGTQAITPSIDSLSGSDRFLQGRRTYRRGDAVQLVRARLPGMVAGNVAVGGAGVAPSIIGISRGLPLIAPFLATFVTPRRPLERIMVMPNSRSRRSMT